MHTTKWSGMIGEFELELDFNDLLEQRCIEVLSVSPELAKKKLDFTKFLIKVKLFWKSDNGDCQYAIAAIKMLSIALKQPVALVIVMPGLPFNDDCGPFLIATNDVIDSTPLERTLV